MLFQLGINNVTIEVRRSKQIGVKNDHEDDTKVSISSDYNEYCLFCKFVIPNNII